MTACTGTNSMQAQSSRELQQSSAKQLAELQWELQHSWQQFEQADKAQQAAMQGAQERIAKLEKDCQQTSTHAARVEAEAARAEAEGAKLAQQLTDVKVSAYCLTSKHMRPEWKRVCCSLIILSLRLAEPCLVWPRIVHAAAETTGAPPHKKSLSTVHELDSVCLTASAYNIQE